MYKMLSPFHRGIADALEQSSNYQKEVDVSVGNVDMRKQSSKGLREAFLKSMKRGNRQFAGLRAGLAGRRAIVQQIDERTLMQLCQEVKQLTKIVGNFHITCSVDAPQQQ